MGGYCALEIMRQAPERVLALCLVDTSARPDTPEGRANRKKTDHALPPEIHEELANGIAGARPVMLET